MLEVIWCFWPDLETFFSLKVDVLEYLGHLPSSKIMGLIKVMVALVCTPLEHGLIIFELVTKVSMFACI